MRRADRDEITAAYPFPLDRFQLEAIDALDAGHHVVVAAPTGSGKTVVAEYGIETARLAGRRAFYTAPLKALSNQKYRDLTARYGRGEVGLLTGDNAIDGDAQVVVMTTEVLRNMIYGRSSALADLDLVVLDEVHFLQDTYRGPVWEEVIVHLPPHVRLICLSATVSNTAELAAWIETVRGPTTPVIELRRPVRLHDAYLVADRTHDRLHFLETFEAGRPNAAAARLDASAMRRGRRGASDRSLRGSGWRKLATPGRVEVVELLDRRGLLPAIVFIFSRNQCEQAARSCLDAGMALTRGTDRDRIRQIVDARLRGMHDDDLAALGYDQFLARLEAGIAAHHAGMVPAFKEVVEACFIEGLIRVVFATETLAVGVNMPARTVVIEKLTKFTGDHHETLTAGEYTQLTGRAGRRGIDDEGHAVVLWSPFVSFEQVAALAASRTFHLRSAFRPTYNMAANLIGTYSIEEARHLLNLSFAQYQADRNVVRSEARMERLRSSLAEARARAASPHGDIWAYRAALDATRARRRGQEHALATSVAALRPGEVVYARKGKYRGPVAVIATADRKQGPRLTTVTAQGQLLLLTADDFAEMPQLLGTVRLPPAYNPNRTEYRKDVARALGRARLETGRGNTRRRGPGGDQDGEAGDSRHPVELDPDLRERMRAAGQAERYARDLEQVAVRVEGPSLARDFDRVLDVLERRAYVDLGAPAAGDDDDRPWALTARGRLLARVFHESDLLVAECVHSGLLDGIDPAALAALVSTFVFEYRSPEPPPPPWFPSADVRRRWQRIQATSEDLEADERSLGLTSHRPPDPGFAAAAHAWVSGEDLAAVVADEELTGGDFVRTMKQLVDLARQLALVAPVRATRQSAAELAARAFRGVVADVPVAPGGGATRAEVARTAAGERAEPAAGSDDAGGPGPGRPGRPDGAGDGPSEVA